MKYPSTGFFSRFLVASAMLMLSGCATQLGPRYDKTVADGLMGANTEVMTLLASTSQGTSSATYERREDKYNSAIGKLDALAVQAAARPMPSNTVLTLVDQALEKRGIATLADDDNEAPSVHPIRKIAESLTKMRDTDKKQGITSFESQAFKGQIVIYLDQAVTYENFLQR